MPRRIVPGALGAVAAVLVACGGPTVDVQSEYADGAIVADAGEDVTAVDAATPDASLDSLPEDAELDAPPGDSTDPADSSVDPDTGTDTGIDTGIDTGTDTGAPTCTGAAKLCDGICVTTMDPSKGCAASDCAPCPATANGTAICTPGGACAIHCQSGYHLCGSTCQPVGPSSCGEACAVCPTPTNATATCSSSGACGYACKGGYTDCNGSAADGCEVDLKTDPTSCGSCGHSCMGDACSGGLCAVTTLAVGQNDPADLALDASYVYWSNSGAGQIVRVPKSGGTSQAIATGQSNPQGLVLDDTYVYWANNTSPGEVRRIAKNGAGSPFTVAASQYYAYRLFLEGSTLYFVGDTTSGFLRSVGKSGGAVTTLQNANSPKGVVVDGSKIYWTHFGEIRAADATAGAPPTKLSNVEQFPGALAQDATNLYWVDVYDDRVRTIPKSGGTPKTLATLANGSSRAALAVDATHVFFVDPKGNLVRKVSKDGSRPAVTIASASDPSGIAIDATHVYWSNAGDGTIKKVAK